MLLFVGLLEVSDHSQIHYQMQTTDINKILGLLIPEYYIYQQTCVHNYTNETYVSANIYALSCNYISLDASKTLTNGYQDYNVQSSNYCSTNKQESDTNYYQLLNTFMQYNSSFQV